MDRIANKGHRRGRIRNLNQITGLSFYVFFLFVVVAGHLGLPSAPPPWALIRANWA